MHAAQRVPSSNLLLYCYEVSGNAGFLFAIYSIMTIMHNFTSHT